MRYKLLIFNCLLLICGLLSAQTEVTSNEVYKLDLPKNAENFSKGIESKNNENYDAAIQYFEEALKYNKDDDASMYELSELYQLKNRDHEAYLMIHNAVNLQPDNKWYKIRLASFYMNHNDYYSVIRIYDELMASEPENLEYLETYINALLRLGDADKVLEKLNLVQDIIGRNELISLQKLEVYKTKGDVQNMIAEMEYLVGKDPDNTRYLSMLAQLYSNNYRKPEALPLLLKVKELEPDNKYVNISLYEYYVYVGNIQKAFDEYITAIKNPNLDYDTKIQLLGYWLGKNANDEIAPVADQAREIGEAFIEVYPDKYVGYSVLGMIYFEQNDMENAQKYFQQSLDREKNNYSNFYQICIADVDLKDYQKAIEHSTEAMSLFPNQPIFYLIMGHAYSVLKEYDKSIDVLEKGRKLVGRSKITHDFDVYLGDIYNIMKNYKKSFQAYDRALEVKPDDITVLNNFAYNLAENNQNLEKALDMSAKTIKAEPKNAMYLDTYAWILFRMGRYKEAKKYMQKVFKYEKEPNGVNYEHLGDILFKLGDQNGAMTNWKKAQAAGDASEVIDEKVEKGTYIELILTTKED